LRHIGNAGRHNVNIYDTGEESDGAVEGGDHMRGRQLFILRKLHETRKFDACMAAILSWEARLAALAKLETVGATSGAVMKKLY
jgi:hypothetical protein